MTQQDYQHAIVIGGSIAGLLAARVLSDHFQQVTILERDALPGDAAHRSGVPQSQHAHALLGRGAQIFEAYFPGLTAEWEADRIAVRDGGEVLDLRLPSGQAPQVETGIPYYAASRIYIEASIRRRVLALPNVEVRERTEVVGLEIDASHDRVLGVWTHPRGSGEEAQLERADLIVNAAGRGSKLVDWLVQHGYDAPQQTTITAHGGYASRWYDAPEGMREAQHIPWVLMQPPTTPRCGVILPIENNRMIVTLIGTDRTYPPTDEDGFEAFARSLPSPIIYDAMKRGTPVGGIKGYRQIESRHWHFEKMRRFPERLIVMGDAFVALNPLYGQGMTAAAVSADALANILTRAQQMDGVNRRFHKKLVKVVAPFWMMATGEDLRWAAAEGAEVTAATRFLHVYIDHLMALMPTHPVLFSAFVRVQHGLAAPTALFQPGVLLPILRRALSRRRSQQLPLKRVTGEFPAAS